MRIVLLFSLILLSSCNGAKKYPQWFYETPTSDAKIYGVGESYSMVDAKQIALDDVASKLSLTVSSKTSSSISRDGKVFNDQFNSDISTEVGKVKFNNYFVEKNEKLGNSYIVMVSVDKKKLFDEKKMQVDSIISSAEKTYSKLSDKSPLEKRNSLVGINKSMKEMIGLSYILFALNDRYNLDQDLAIANDYLQKYNDIMNSFSIVISDNTDPSIYKIIVDLFNSRNFTVISKDKLDNLQNVVFVNIQSSVIKDTIYNGYATNLTLNFTIGTEKKVINSNTIQVSGTSSISYDEALNSALGALKAKVNSEGFEAVFGMQQI